MNWSDEHYVKLYTRDTATWLSWPWEARAVFPLVMRKLDGAGLMASGRLELARAIAVMIGVPEEVVAPAVDTLIADGTIQRVASGLLVPKFLEAQEARKTDKRKSADYRAKVRDEAKLSKTLDGAVTPRHTASHGVTICHPPALPCPAQPSPEKLAGTRPPADPRLKSLTETLVTAFAAIRGEKYRHGGARDSTALKSLLPLATDAAIATRWASGLRASGWASCSTISQLAVKWNDLGAATPAKPTEEPLRML